MAVEILKSVQIPTLDHPFGIPLWPIFEKAYEATLGYPADQFEFVQGKTPVSTWKETVIALVGYYVVIFGGRELMKHRSPFVLKGPFIVHNLFLTIISGVLLALFTEQLLPTIARRGIFYAICDINGGWTKELVLLYYVSVIFRVSYKICRSDLSR